MPYLSGPNSALTTPRPKQSHEEQRRGGEPKPDGGDGLNENFGAFQPPRQPRLVR